MLPLTLGANIGTTITGLLASLVSGKVDALQVALAHLFFNQTGIAIWYPIPFMRKVPLEGARALGRWTRRSRAVPPIYILVVFFIIPLLLMGLSELFAQKMVGYTVLGTFLVIIVAALLAKTVWWWTRKDGKAKFLKALDRHQSMSETKRTLPADMQYLKAKVDQLVEHTGLPEDDEEGAVGAEVEPLKPVDEEAVDEEVATSEEDNIDAMMAVTVTGSN